MKKYNFVINLAIQLLLNIVCIFLICKYVISTAIPIELYIGFPNNLYLTFMGYTAVTMLVIFAVVTIICIITGFLKIKNSEFEKSDKKPLYIIPLAKAGYLEKFYNDNDVTIKLLCTYQQANYKFINDKFEKLSENDYSFKNKEEKDNYTLYYEAGDNSSSYALTVIKGDYRYIAIFECENTSENSYSVDDFVSDSLNVYNEWCSLIPVRAFSPHTMTLKLLNGLCQSYKSFTLEI